MEYAPNGSLFDLIKVFLTLYIFAFVSFIQKHKDDQECIDEDEILRRVVQIARGLQGFFIPLSCVHHILSLLCFIW